MKSFPLNTATIVTTIFIIFSTNNVPISTWTTFTITITTATTTVTGWWLWWHVYVRRRLDWLWTRKNFWQMFEFDETNKLDLFLSWHQLCYLDMSESKLKGRRKTGSFSFFEVSWGVLDYNAEREVKYEVSEKVSSEGRNITCVKVKNFCFHLLLRRFPDTSCIILVLPVSDCSFSHSHSHLLLLLSIGSLSLFLHTRYFHSLTRFCIRDGRKRTFSLSLPTQFDVHMGF